MFAQARLKEIAARKRVLVAEGDLRRAMMAVEYEQATARLTWLATAGKTLQSHAAWLMPAAAVGGLLAARHWRELAKWIPAGLAAWRWFRRLTPD